MDDAKTPSEVSEFTLTLDPEQVFQQLFRSEHFVADDLVEAVFDPWPRDGESAGTGKLRIWMGTWEQLPAYLHRVALERGCDD